MPPTPPGAAQGSTPPSTVPVDLDRTPPPIVRKPHAKYALLRIDTELEQRIERDHEREEKGAEGRIVIMRTPPPPPHIRLGQQQRRTTKTTPLQTCTLFMAPTAVPPHPQCTPAPVRHILSHRQQVLAHSVPYP
ncbi:hypothetical protein K439DRAFT_1614627 [Ramaria rubella]|nr:hypothetical protein K439DRAFT_1614627 [Ramaria rubella]